MIFRVIVTMTEDNYQRHYVVDSQARLAELVDWLAARSDRTYVVDSQCACGAPAEQTIELASVPYLYCAPCAETFRDGQARRERQRRRDRADSAARAMVYHAHLNAKI